jgi:hypothetical protein
MADEGMSIQPMRRRQKIMMLERMQLQLKDHESEGGDWFFFTRAFALMNDLSCQVIEASDTYT